MGDGPILKLTCKLNLNLVCTRESTAAKDVGTPMSRPRSQFNAVQLQVAIGLGWWVLGKTDFSSSSHHLIKMMKNRRRGRLTILLHATTVHWRGKIYLLAQYKCYSDMSGKSLQCLCIVLF